MLFKVVEMLGETGLDIEVDDDADLLGAGSSGSVYRIRSREGWVVKLPHSADKVAYIRTEIKVAQRLGPHPHILFGTGGYACCPERILCLLMPFGGKPLEAFLRGDRTGDLVLVPDHATLALFLENIGDALEFLHRHKTKHGDIDVSNILFRGDRASGTECFALIDLSAAEDADSACYDLWCTRNVFSALYQYVYRQECPVVSDEEIRVLGMQVFEVLHAYNNRHRPTL